jgi:hypothetical protein
MKTIFLSWLSLCLFGCASVTNDTMQLVRVETLTPEGQFVKGAPCKFTNDYSTIEGKSGDSVLVHRSNQDLDINCSTPGNNDAAGRAISRANSGMLGNILVGGGIGAIIDHNRGTAYTYPTWIRLVFGQARTFDRTDEMEGKVLMGRVSDLPAINAVVMENPATSQPIVLPQAAEQPAYLSTGYARIDDIDAIPHLSDNGRKAYSEWLNKSTPRAFAISATGSYGWANGTPKSQSESKGDPSQRALFKCEERAKIPCKLYAVNNAVVWPKGVEVADKPATPKYVDGSPKPSLVEGVLAPSGAGFATPQQ